MSSTPPKIIRAEQAAGLLASQSDTIAVVENPAHVFPPYALYPLAPPRTQLTEGLVAVVMDMDGTTTTTETLCIGALETMVQRLSGDKTGLTLHVERDYPHIIGNSTTKHVEYLVRTYGAHFHAEAMCRHFIAATACTLARPMEPLRAQGAANALRNQGLSGLLDDPRFERLQTLIHADDADVDTPLAELTATYRDRLRMDSVTDKTCIGIEVYYRQYHAALHRIAGDGGMSLAGVSRPIEPMPGIAVALALLKGWLAEDAAALSPLLAKQLNATSGHADTVVADGCARFPELARRFAARPAKIGLVTSSIAAEADIVLREVFRVIRDEVGVWPLPLARRQFLQEKFADPDTVYDARITASDASEIRLKPHRDLYAIALHALGVSPDEFGRVAGFEDSESGVIAMRAAGISLCCALPFAMTRNHGFEAATQCCPGGMPEVMLLKNFFLPE